MECPLGRSTATQATSHLCSLSPLCFTQIRKVLRGLILSPMVLGNQACQSLKLCIIRRSSMRQTHHHPITSPFRSHVLPLPSCGLLEAVPLSMVSITDNQSQAKIVDEKFQKQLLASKSCAILSNILKSWPSFSVPSPRRAAPPMPPPPLPPPPCPVYPHLGTTGP